MPTTSRDPVSTVRAWVERWSARLGPGLVGLACSGGADSMALADAAIAACGPSQVIVVHVDHQLAPGSGQVAAGVARWARGQGVAAVIREVNVPARASLEAAARQVRYQALEAVAAEVGCRWIWLAHTARDQAETVLMRVVRGTGPAGLAGIPALRDPFVRPLLELSREVIDAYVAARQLPVWEDPMNDDPRVARVRFRRRHLPALRDENPALDDALCRLAASAREWTAAIDELAALHARLPASCRALAALPVAVRKRALALALERQGVGLDAAHLDALDRLVRAPAAGESAVDVPGSRVVRSYDELDVTPRVVVAPALRDELVVPAGHALRLWRPGDRMRLARLKGRSRKLSDLYVDAKLPRAQRRAARVLVRDADQVIVWAEHLGAAYGESALPLPARTGRDF